MTYLEFYEQCMIVGKMPKKGLCNALPKNLKNTQNIFGIVRPTKQDETELVARKLPCSYWGLEDWKYEYDDFTPLRQTLVLLMAAIAGEFDN